MRELRAQFPPPLGGARAAAAAAGKREPYPPARLWYRVSVEFKGSKVFTDRASGLPEPEDANWKLESRHAVRLTLLCVNVKLDPGPFVVSERIRGRQQRVGGCPRPTKQEPRKNLRETVRFAATANGEVTRWQLDDPIDFGAGCPGRVTHQELVEHHPLTGTISSPSSATAGLTVFADAVQPSTVTANAPPIQCLLTPQGPAYEKPAIALSYPSTSLLFGDEREKVNGKPISEQLTVRFPPERFGRDYDYTITLVQPEEGPHLPRTTRTRCASRPARGTGAMSRDARPAQRKWRPTTPPWRAVPRSRPPNRQRPRKHECSYSTTIWALLRSRVDAVVSLGWCGRSLRTSRSAGRRGQLPPGRSCIRQSSSHGAAIAFQAERRVTFSAPDRQERVMHEVLFDAAGRRRSPATMPGFHAGRPPRNKGRRYPADPPAAEDLVAVIRQAGTTPHGFRLRGLIVVLWRAGLRIHEALALTEADLDARRGSVLVRRGKGGRSREVGMDDWAWEQLQQQRAVDRHHWRAAGDSAAVERRIVGRAAGSTRRHKRARRGSSLGSALETHVECDPGSPPRALA